MRYTQGHKSKTRLTILMTAARLFARRGYEATSIEEVMRVCGLTRGGFYRHFKSKEHLYRETVAFSAEHPDEDTALAVTAMLLGAAALVQGAIDDDVRTRLLTACERTARLLLETRLEPLTYFWAAQ
jgi:AcrR family transcriptional regulator